MESLAVILLLLLAIALLAAFASGGWKGIGSWWHAKFIGYGQA